MYKYIESYEMGFIEGINEAIKDSKNKKIKLLKNKLNIDVMAKLYDIGYMNGYNKYIKDNKLFYLNKK